MTNTRGSNFVISAIDPGLSTQKVVPLIDEKGHLSTDAHDIEYVLHNAGYIVEIDRDDY